MREVAVVIGKDMQAIYWHNPSGSNGASIPDSRDLWDILWSYREEIIGVAHTHPAIEESAPSYTDVTTFRAIELALGKPLLWWIVSQKGLATFMWDPQTSTYCKVPYRYSGAELFILETVERLRELSYNNKETSDE